MLENVSVYAGLPHTLEICFVPEVRGQIICGKKKSLLRVELGSLDVNIAMPRIVHPTAGIRFREGARKIFEERLQRNADANGPRGR